MHTAWWSVVVAVSTYRALLATGLWPAASCQLKYSLSAQAIPAYMPKPCGYLLPSPPFAAPPQSASWDMAGRAVLSVPLARAPLGATHPLRRPNARHAPLARPPSLRAATPALAAQVTCLGWTVYQCCAWQAILVGSFSFGPKSCSLARKRMLFVGCAQAGAQAPTINSALLHVVRMMLTNDKRLLL